MSEQRSETPDIGSWSRATTTDSLQDLPNEKPARCSLAKLMDRLCGGKRRKATPDRDNTEDDTDKKPSTEPESDQSARRPAKSDQAPQVTVVDRSRSSSVEAEPQRDRGEQQALHHFHSPMIVSKPPYKPKKCASTGDLPPNDAPEDQKDAQGNNKNNQKISADSQRTLAASEPVQYAAWDSELPEDPVRYYRRIRFLPRRDDFVVRHYTNAEGQTQSYAPWNSQIEYNPYSRLETGKRKYDHRSCAPSCSYPHFFGKALHGDLKPRCNDDDIDCRCCNVIVMPEEVDWRQFRPELQLPFFNRAREQLKERWKYQEEREAKLRKFRKSDKPRVRQRVQKLLDEIDEDFAAIVEEDEQSEEEYKVLMRKIGANRIAKERAEQQSMERPMNVEEIKREMEDCVQARRT